MVISQRHHILWTHCYASYGRAMVSRCWGGLGTGSRGATRGLSTVRRERSRRENSCCQTETRSYCPVRAGGQFGCPAWRGTFHTRVDQNRKVFLEWTHTCLRIVVRQSGFVDKHICTDANRQLEVGRGRRHDRRGRRPSAVPSSRCAQQTGSSRGPPPQSRSGLSLFQHGKFVLRPHNNRCYGKTLSGSGVLNTNSVISPAIPSGFVVTHTHTHT